MTPMRGEMGTVSARDLLALLAATVASGTLVLTRGAVARTLRLTHGQPSHQIDLGGAFDLNASGGAFVFWPDAVMGSDTDFETDFSIDPVPTLPSRYPAARGPLWALPVLAEQPLLSTAETDLRAVTARLERDGFGGALVLGAPGYGLLLFQAGRLAGAVLEDDTGLSRGDAALRALSGEAEGRAELTLHALPGGVVADVLGLVLGLQLGGITDTPNGAPNTVPDGFSGLELTPAGARYYAAGSPYLFVPRPEGVPVTTGLFAPSLRTPSLSLPSEPHGWERRAYSLTLRGRDALNPLTELSMRFRGEFGRAGQRALEQFRTEGSVEAAATALSVELGDLKPTVERLHTEGFLRPTGEASPTPPGRLR